MKCKHDFSCILCVKGYHNYKHDLNCKKCGEKFEAEDMNCKHGEEHSGSPCLRCGYENPEIHSQVAGGLGIGLETTTNSTPDNHSQDNTSVGITEPVVRSPQNDGLVVMGTGTTPGTFKSLIAETEGNLNNYLNLEWEMTSAYLQGEIDGIKKAQKIVVDAIERSRHCNELGYWYIDEEDLMKEIGI